MDLPFKMSRGRCSKSQQDHHLLRYKRKWPLKSEFKRRSDPGDIELKDTDPDRRHHQRKTDPDEIHDGDNIKERVIPTIHPDCLPIIENSEYLVVPDCREVVRKGGSESNQKANIMEL